MISLIIGGDIVPSFKNLDYFYDGIAEKIADKSCLELLQSADFRIFNLETPITNDVNPILKEGAAFHVSDRCINGLKALNIDALAIANNHIKDQGENGLQQTIGYLKKCCITPFGYGDSFHNCVDSIYFEKEGKRITIIACAETEFSIFTDEEIGAMPYNDYWTNKAISQAKQQSDVVIVLYHGGKEYFRYASPYLRERCRLMADNGADFILCQHSHCISCYEKYNNTTILYGQGNFIFHQKNNKPETKEGLLAYITIDDRNKQIEFIPVTLNEDDQICIPDKTIRERIIEDFNERSNIIKDDKMVEKLYSEFAKSKTEFYYNRLSGSNSMCPKIIARIKRRFWNKNRFSKSDKLAILNLLQNEAHRELFIEAIKNDIYKIEVL